MTVKKRALIGLAALLATAAVQAEVKDGRSLNRYATSERSWGVNAYWMESEQGLVLIDSLLLVPDAENLAAVLKARNKPLLGVLLTHPHVDHFGGLSTIRKHFPEVPIYATAATTNNIRPVHERAYEQGWIQAFGADYDKNVVLPNKLVESGSTVILGDMHFQMTSFGAMESADNVLIYSPEFEVLFTGDAVMNGPIYYLGEGHSHGVMEGLERIAQAYPANQRAFPSHGDPGWLGPMVEHELAQVAFMREQMSKAIERPKALTDEGKLSDASRARLSGIFTEHFRHYLTFGLGSETLAWMNMSGLEPELLAERKAAAEKTAP